MSIQLARRGAAQVEDNPGWEYCALPARRESWKEYRYCIADSFTTGADPGFFGQGAQTKNEFTFTFASFAHGSAAVQILCWAFLVAGMNKRNAGCNCTSAQGWVALGHHKSDLHLYNPCILRYPEGYHASICEIHSFGWSKFGYFTMFCEFLWDKEHRSESFLTQTLVRMGSFVWALVSGNVAPKVPKCWRP